MGAVVSEDQRKSIAEYVEGAREEGADVFQVINILIKRLRLHQGYKCLQKYFVDCENEFLLLLTKSNPSSLKVFHKIALAGIELWSTGVGRTCTANSATYIALVLGRFLNLDGTQNFHFLYRSVALKPVVSTHQP